VTQTELGSVVSLWRYPVKSMMGEELNASEVTDRGLLGDRTFALVDCVDGKVVSAKNPRKWPGLFDFRAALAASPRPDADLTAASVLEHCRASLPAAKVPKQVFIVAQLPKSDRGKVLRDLLRRAGLKAKALQVSFQGLDEAPLPSVSDFVKALDVSHALSPDVLVAYEMNGAPLPMINGFPIRLIVPGWYATYWVKSLAEITVLPHRFDGFWMAKAYKIPATPNGVESPDHLAEKTVPINRLNVRSFFTSPGSSAKVSVGQPCPLDGIAFDGGKGIRKVEVSLDGGQSWQAGEVGEDLGRYSVRRWRLTWTPTERGELRLQVRASNRAGAVQPAEAGWNRGGYMRNVIEELPVTVV